MHFSVSDIPLDPDGLTKETGHDVVDVFSSDSALRPCGRITLHGHDHTPFSWASYGEVVHGGAVDRYDPLLLMFVTAGEDMGLREEKTLLERLNHAFFHCRRRGFD